MANTTADKWREYRQQRGISNAPAVAAAAKAKEKTPTQGINNTKGQTELLKQNLIANKTINKSAQETAAALAKTYDPKTGMYLKTLDDYENHLTRLNEMIQDPAYKSDRKRLKSERKYLTNKYEEILNEQAGGNRQPANIGYNALKLGNTDYNNFSQNISINTDTAGDWIGYAKYLASKPDWTDDDRETAGRMLSALGGKNLGEKAMNTLRGGNAYIKELSKNDIAGDELEALEIYNNLYSRYHPKAAAAAYGLFAGLGGESIAKGYNALLSKSDNPYVQVVSANVDRQLKNYEQNKYYAAKEAPGVYSAGNIAGNIAVMSSIASGIGAIPGFTSIPAIAQSAISGAGALGLSTAYQEAGSAAAGEQSWGDYAKNIITSAISGGAGGALSGALGYAGLNILKNKNLITNKLARAAVAGIAGAGYATASTAVNETASFLKDKDNYKFNYVNAVERILIGFAFGALGSLTKNYTTDPKTAAQMDYDNELAEKYFGGMSQKEARAAYRAFAKEYSDILNFTGGKENMTPEMLARYNTLQDINRAYDRFVILSGTSAYNKAQAAKAANDAEAYAQSTQDFKDAVIAIKEAASEAGSAVNPEAVEILEAVQNGMSEVAPAVNTDTFPSVPVQAAVQAAMQPENIVLPTAETGTLPTAAEQNNTVPDTETATAPEQPNINARIERLNDVYEYLVRNTGSTATEEQINTALQVVNKARELKAESQNEQAIERLNNIDIVMSQYADFYKARSLPATQDNGNIELPTAENSTLPTAEGEINNGRNSILNGSEGRNAGTSTGEQARRLDRGAEESAPVNQGRRAIEAQNLTRSLRLERQSSAELGIGKYATENKTAAEIPQENWTDYMKANDERAYQESGKHVRYVTGPIEIKGASGEIKNARAVNTDNGFIVRADHSRYTIEQLTDHEMYEEMAMQTPGLDAAMRERIIGTYTQAEYDRVLSKYMENIQGLYDNITEYSSGDEIEEATAKIERELFADAYAGINAFGAGANRFRETAREVTGEYAPSGAVRRENAAAINRRNGPPERTSIDDEVQRAELPAVYADESQEKVVDLSKDNELSKRIGNITGSAKYKIIKQYILEKLGREVTFNDGTTAILDNSDAAHVANKAADKKTAEISVIDKLIQSAEPYAEDTNVEHNKFDYFKYYEAFVKYDNQTFPIYFNVGRGKFDSKYHLYDITQRIKDTAHRFNDVGRPRRLRPISDISYKQDTTDTFKSQEGANEDLSGKIILPTADTDNDAPIGQAISSAKTSIKQIPALFRNPNVSFGDVNIDIGGGRFDLATDYLKSIGTENMVFDPYNRSAEVNSATLRYLQDGNKADTATCANVLNVIAEPAARANVILETAKAIKPDGTAYFMVYEGDGSGIGRETSAGYQNNRTTADYISEIEQYFDNVERKGKLIIATEPKSDLPKAAWEIQPGEAVRFSLDEPIEETENLVALHNLSEDKLHKALMLGGFPMPSIAVTKSDIPHTNFGDITLVMNKSTVDPQADYRNTVYSADAWTPTFPSTEYEVNEKVADRLRRKYYELYRKFGNDATRPLYPWGNYPDDELDRIGGEAKAIEQAENDVDMMKLFLMDEGLDVPETVADEKVDRLDDGTIRFYDHFINALGEDAFRELTAQPGQSVGQMRKDWWAKYGEAFEDAYREYMTGLGFSAEEIENVLDNESVAAQTRKALEMRNYILNGPEKRTVTTNIEATNQAIRDATDQEAYSAWLHSLFDGLEKSSGIYNGRDRYTPSGNRRSFSSTHVPVTLENIARVMARENDGNSRNVDGFYGVKSLRAGMAERFNSIDRMHEIEGRLQHLTDEEAEQINNELSNRLTALMQEIYDTKTHSPYDNSFIEMDAIGQMMMEATETRPITTDAIIKAFKGSGYTVDSERANEIKELLFDISQMPVNIFEAKPERAVRFDEVLAAVVPKDTSQYIKDGLRRNGVDVLEYEKDNTEDRLAKVNSVEDARFSIDDDDLSGNITLPTADSKLQERIAKENRRAEQSRNKNKEYLSDRIAMLSDMDYQKSLLERGGIEALRANEREIRDLQKRIDRLNGVKPEPRQRKPEPKVAQAKPTQATAEFKNKLMALFSIPDGSKREALQMIDSVVDQVLTDGRISYSDQRKLFDALYERGIVTVEPQGEYRDIRAELKNAKIYVSPQVKSEFTDTDYNDLRKRAFAAGVYFVDDSSVSGIDSYLRYMSESFPGFLSEDVDARGGLERIVQLAEEGREEKMSLAEYADYMNRTEGISPEDELENMERQFDWIVDTFADKAKFEVDLKNRTRLQLAQDKAERKESMQRQRDYKALQDIQNRTLKQLQWLSRNRDKAPADLKQAFDDVLSDIDIYAVSMADELHWSNKYQATWKDLAQMYKDARESDPNFLPSKELERIISRLDDKKIGDMDYNAVTDLYRAAVALRNEYYNRNNVINDEQHRLFSEVYDSVTQEINDAKGGYKGKGSALDDFVNYEQLTPMNVLRRMSGWNKDGAWYSMIKQLERGEQDYKAFITTAKQYLSDFADENKDWLRTADGQGRNGKWYEIEVPELLELKMGDKPIFGDTVKVYMTPLQKVHMYLESKNYDNLRHMAGGRTFADKDLYSKGKRDEAYAQGKTIRLAPETVKAIVSDLTDEERELAALLEYFYNNTSSASINKISNILYGYEKAIHKNYAPIFTNKNYVNSEFGVFDVSAEGVGNLKARQASRNPSLNISAIDAFNRHAEQTARFVGYAIPVRNWTTLMNWSGNGTSMRDVISHKWGDKVANKNSGYIANLINTLQSGTVDDKSSIEKALSKALSHYVSATFGFNPGIVFKQAASYPLAAAVLGWRNMPAAGMLARADRDLISKYTKELDYRTLGYATPETAQLRNNPTKLSTNKATKFLFGGDAIIAMDAATVKRLWPWAVNYVRREYPDLEVGTQEQIDAGESPFYKKVAEVFNDAVSTTQPMYDIMHRPNIMQHGGLTRAFTMFKTVTLQQYNTQRRKFGELQSAKQKYKNANTEYGKEKARQEHRRASRDAADSVIGLILCTAMYEGYEFLNQLVKNKGKKYRDEEGDLTVKSVTERIAINAAEDAAGMMIAGKEVSEILANILLGEKWYGISIPGGEQLNTIIDSLIDGADTIMQIVDDGANIINNDGDLKEYFKRKGPEYAGALKDMLETMATYISGFPMGNIEKYLMGVMQYISPELHTAMQDVFKAPTKSGLEGLDDEQLKMRISDIFDNRSVKISDTTEQTLAELYKAGIKNAIPSGVMTKTTINGEEHQLDAYQQQTFSTIWSGIVGGELDNLTASREFRNMTKGEQGAAVKLLYDYATEQAKHRLFNDYEPNYAKITDSVKSGLSWIDAAQVYLKHKEINASNDKPVIKTTEFYKWLDDQGYSENQIAKIKDSYKFYSMVPAEAKGYEKFTDIGINQDDAYKIVNILDELEPEGEDEKVTVEQKYDAIKGASISNDSKNKAYGSILRSYLGKSEYKADIAEDHDIDASEYLEFKVILPKYDDDKNGSYKQAEVAAALRAMPGLTNDERAALWQLQTGSTTSKNNPFNKSVGSAVIYAMSEAKGN